MRKFIVSLFVIILLIGSGISVPVNSASNEEIKDYLVFFRDQKDLSEKLYWINQFKKWDHNFETTVFNKMSACQIIASAGTFKLIQEQYPEIVFFPNYRFSASPVDSQSVATPTSSVIPWNIESIHANWLWEKGITGKDVHLAVLDTGVDGNHKDLKGKIINFAYIDRSGVVIKEPLPYDTDTHGTHVSGIIAGGSVEKPLGVSPNAKLSVGVVIPGGGGSFTQIMGGLEWILDPDQNPETNDAPRAVNLSLGAPGYLTIWSSILTKLLNQNTLPIFSAGNDGDGITSTPGNTPRSFCAGAFDANNKIATFSSGADHLIWEDGEISLFDYTKPDISAPGVKIVSSVPGNQYEAMSGTSMAAPHVTGSVGLLTEAFPDISAYDLRAYMESSSEDLGIPGDDTRYGKGKLDLKETYIQISEAIKVTGQLNNPENLTLKWREINRPVYINQENKFISYLEPGTYHLDVCYGQNVIKTIPFQNLEKSIQLTITDLPKIDEIVIEGKVMDAKGNPLSSTIVSSLETLQTDLNGQFAIKTNLFESIEVFSSGYKNKSFYIKENNGFYNIKLQKADLLLIEGNSFIFSEKNPPRNVKQFYTQALDELGISYAYVQTNKLPLTFDYIMNFTSVIAFYSSGSATREEGKVFSKYLDSGGRLIVSGRLLLYLEQYFSHDFFQTYFGVTSKYTIPTPSVISYSDSGPFSGFLFPLTGDGGANNQEFCEMLQRSEDGKPIIPLLRYSDAGKEFYAAVSISNGNYRGILMSFGFEGIGHSVTRLEWMRAMLEWINETHSIQIEFDENFPHHIKVLNNSQPIIDKVVKEKEIFYRNLEVGEYEVSLHTLGYEIENFKFTMKSGEYYSIRSFPKLSSTQTVQLQFEFRQDNPVYYQLYFYDYLISEDILTIDTFNSVLPSGAYTLKAFASTMEPLVYKWTVTDQPIEKKLEFKVKKKKVLLIDNSLTGDYYLDNYLRLGEFYNKYFTSNVNGVDFWDVSVKGFPLKFELLPYEVVYYFSGINQNALTDTEHLSVFSFYLDQGGNVIFNGNCHHANLKGTLFLQNYFGIDIYSTNIREQTVIGSNNTIMAELSFDLIDSMSENGVYTPYPSLTILKNDTIPVFTYLSGKISSSYCQRDQFRTLYISFGLDNITKSATRLDLVNKSIQLVLNGIG